MRSPRPAASIIAFKWRDLSGGTTGAMSHCLLECWCDPFVDESLERVQFRIDVDDVANVRASAADPQISRLAVAMPGAKSERL
jgi:hypothetical protein